MKLNAFVVTAIALLAIAPLAAHAGISEEFAKMEDSLGELISEIEKGKTKVCPLFGGVCYNEVGQFSSSSDEVLGSQGKEATGCARPVVGCSFKGGHRTQCRFSPCPTDFLPEGESRSSCVDNTNACKASCNAARDSSNCVLNENVMRITKANHSAWMKDVQSLPLNELLVAGSHHTLARTHGVNFDHIVEKLAGMALVRAIQKLGKFGPLPAIRRQVFDFMLPMMLNTQVSDVATMLYHGVRMFDFRPYLFSGNEKRYPGVPAGLYDYHLGQGPAMKPEMEAIAAHLRAHPTEMVYLEVQNFLTKCFDCSPDVIRVFGETVQEVFGSCDQKDSLLYCGPHDNFSKPLKEYAGKVIIFSDVDDFLKANPFVVRASIQKKKCSEMKGAAVCARYYNKNSNVAVRDAILDDDDATHLVKENPNLLRLFQYQLTAQKDDYLGALTQRFTNYFQDRANPAACGSLACMARASNTKLFMNTFAKDNFAKLGGRGNIVLLDFSDMEGIEELIEWNIKKFNGKN
eukprot:Nk52_evm4s375 gene=Nk52_evmTU4s375